MPTNDDKARLYQLKRRFGRRIVILQRTTVEVDIETGNINDAYTEIVVDKAIVFFGSLKPKFIYDITYLAANKNFTYGGEHNQISMTLIIDSRDIQDAIQSTGRVMVDGKIYNFENIRYDSLTGCHILRAVGTGELPNA